MRQGKNTASLRNGFFAHRAKINGLDFQPSAAKNTQGHQKMLPLH
jgi:hypothetical protein